VQKTGDIKDLVILEESGIAKGIRRIIAVTGEDAHAVQRLAEEFSARLSVLEKKTFRAWEGAGNQDYAVRSQPTLDLGDHQVQIS
jgi:alanyl-tRNA synthetase